VPSDDEFRALGALAPLLQGDPDDPPLPTKLERFRAMARMMLEESSQPPVQ
jgi:hypothetical protein